MVFSHGGGLKRGAGGAGLVLAGVLALAGCNGSSGKAASDEASGKAAVGAVASNTQVQKDESAVASQIVSPCVAKATGMHPVQGFENCVEAKVPPEDRAQVKACLVKAAGTDNVLTKAGRKEWLDVSANECVTAGIPGLGASPAASVTVSPSPAVSK